MQVSDDAVSLATIMPSTASPTERSTVTKLLARAGITMASNGSDSVITDPAEADALAAFDAAQKAGLPTMDCYRAAVDAWCRAYPHQRRACCTKSGDGDSRGEGQPPYTG
jgi:hypothetical protein